MGGGVSSGDRVECESGEEGRESVMVGEGRGSVRVGEGRGSVRVRRRGGRVQG